MKMAGMAQTQKFFFSFARYIAPDQRTIIASVWLVQEKYLQMTV